jgi:hypothetical protein
MAGTLATSGHHVIFTSPFKSIPVSKIVELRIHLLASTVVRGPRNSVLVRWTEMAMRRKIGCGVKQRGAAKTGPGDPTVPTRSLATQAVKHADSRITQRHVSDDILCHPGTANPARPIRDVHPPLDPADIPHFRPQREELPAKQYRPLQNPVSR